MSSKVRALDLPLTAVHVKFFMTPADDSTIPTRTRNEATIEARHRQEALARGLDPHGLGRGKADSGDEVLRGTIVGIGEFVAELLEQGFRLTDAFQGAIRSVGRSQQNHQVVFIFTREGDELTLSPVDATWLEARLTEPFANVFVWANPKGDGNGAFTHRVDTVNCKGPQRRQMARKTVRLNDAGYTEAPVSQETASV